MEMADHAGLALAGIADDRAVLQDDASCRSTVFSRAPSLNFHQFGMAKAWSVIPDRDDLGHDARCFGNDAGPSVRHARSPAAGWHARSAAWSAGADQTSGSAAAHRDGE